MPDGHAYSSQLVGQIVDLNHGRYLDDQYRDGEATRFSIGVAGYPEKHAEALNMTVDLMNLKKKVDAGAQYIVTQMFFDNGKYFSFVNACRSIGITVPIIPGLKPIASKRDLSLIPQTFGVDLPEALTSSLKGRFQRRDHRNRRSMVHRPVERALCRRGSLHSLLYAGESPERGPDRSRRLLTGFGYSDSWDTPFLPDSGSRRG